MTLEPTGDVDELDVLMLTGWLDATHDEKAIAEMTEPDSA